VLKLLPEIVTAKFLEKYPTEDKQLGLARKRGLFLNEHCLEVDLFKAGRHKSMCQSHRSFDDERSGKDAGAAMEATPASLDTVAF